MIKKMTTEPTVYQISSFLAVLRTTLINNNINIEVQRAWPPSIQIFVNQFNV